MRPRIRGRFYLLFILGAAPGQSLGAASPIPILLFEASIDKVGLRALDPGLAVLADAA